MQEVISAKGLSKTYGNTAALSNVSLSVRSGEVFGLLGANGAGKTTTIECLLGVTEPDAGAVELLGMDPRSARKRVFERVGVQFQEVRYQDKIKVDELCRATRALYADPADYVGLLVEFGLAEKRGEFVEALSGGQKQRLFIVLALISAPEVVFLDELTTGLDVRARRDVWRCLRRMKDAGLTVFLTSHSMEEVEQLCDRIAMLKAGNIVFEGTVQEAVSSAAFSSFEEAYLFYTGEETDEIW